MVLQAAKDTNDKHSSLKIFIDIEYKTLCHGPIRQLQSEQFWNVLE